MFTQNKQEFHFWDINIKNNKINHSHCDTEIGQITFRRKLCFVCIKIEINSETKLSTTMNR